MTPHHGAREKNIGELVTDCLCSVPCYPAKYAFIVIFIYDILLLNLTTLASYNTVVQPESKGA